METLVFFSIWCAVGIPVVFWLAWKMQPVITRGDVATILFYGCMTGPLSLLAVLYFYCERYRDSAWWRKPVIKRYE